jgi:hypothetical protein
MYLFEDYPGQDYYYREMKIREAIDDIWKEIWPNEAKYRFIAVVAKLQLGTETGDEYELNKEPFIKRQNGADDYLPRQLFVRVLNDNQRQWDVKNHQEHTYQMAQLLNKDVQVAKASRNSGKLKEYYVDESMSWITPEHEILPLGMYVRHTVMRRKIMPFIFHAASLNGSWAEVNKEIVHRWFANGKSTTARELGISFDYDWKKDEYYQASVVKKHSSNNCTNMSEIDPLLNANVKTLEHDDLQTNTDSEEEEYANMVKKLPRKITPRMKSSLPVSPNKRACVQPVSPTKIEKKRRRVTRSTKNPYIDDEAVEDDGVVSDGGESAKSDG